MLRRTVALLMATSIVIGACSSSEEPTGTSDPSSTTAPSAPVESTVPPDTDATGSALRDIATLGTTVGTDGRVYIADGDGRALQFRGFNIKTDDPLADASELLLDDGAARGFDLLRLSIYWDQLEPVQGEYDEAYLAAYEEALDRAAARGLHVIVSFHQDVFGPAFGFSGIPEWATRTDGLEYTQQEVWLANYLEPAVQAAWDHLYEDEDIRDAQAATWAMVAERFGDHPAVLGYDLLNEPFGKIGGGEDLVAAASRAQAEQMTPMYQRLIDAMRPADPDGWMFIEAPNVASIGLPVAIGPIDDDRVVFFPHMYDANIEGATYGEGEIELDLSFFETYEPVIRTYPEANGVPMMVGEWGLASPERPGMDQFVAETLALMDRVGSGWTVFNWCRGEGYCPIDENGQDRPNIGQIVQPWAKAIAGAPTSFGFDLESSVLTVRFDDNEAVGTTDIEAVGTTDIALTAGTTYPDGWSIATSDADATNEYDEITGVLSVTTPVTGGSHAICVGPGATPPPCDL